MREYAKLISGVRFELERRKQIFSTPSAELGGFCREEWYLRDEILLSWPLVCMAFWCFMRPKRLLQCGGQAEGENLVLVWGLSFTFLGTWRVFVHPRLGFLVGSRDEELEAAKHVFLALCRVQKSEVRRGDWQHQALLWWFQGRHCSPSFGIQVLMWHFVCYRQYGWRQLIEALRSLVGVWYNSSLSAFQARLELGFEVNLEGAERFYRARWSQEIYLLFFSTAEHGNGNKSSGPCVVIHYVNASLMLGEKTTCCSVS